MKIQIGWKITLINFNNVIDIKPNQCADVQRSQEVKKKY